MKDILAWIDEKLFHRKRDQLLIDKIEEHQQLLKKVDAIVTAALDGETGWFDCSCIEIPKTLNGKVQNDKLSHI